MESESNTTPRGKVDEAHRTLIRYQGRTAGDWARDGYSLQAAQAAVEKAHADYMAAFMAYAEGR